MEYCFTKQYNSLQVAEAYPNVSSPEMFDSDAENDINNRNDNALLSVEASAAISPQRPTQAELVAKSDNYLLTRINKFLSGIPPPPKHTMCQYDCSDLLQRIYENRRFFSIKCPLLDKISEYKENVTSPKQSTITETNMDISHECTKTIPRNLTDAFDACDLSINNANSMQLDDVSDNLNARLSMPKEINKLETNVIKDTGRTPSFDKLESSVRLSMPKETNELETNVIKDIGRIPFDKLESSVSDKQSPVLYYTLDETKATNLMWPEAFAHKFHGIQ